MQKRSMEDLLNQNQGQAPRNAHSERKQYATEVEVVLAVRPELVLLLSVTSNASAIQSLGPVGPSGPVALQGRVAPSGPVGPVGTVES